MHHDGALGSVGKRPGLAWLLVAAWALFVLGLGSDAFSASSTSRVLAPLLRWLFPALTPAELMELQHWIRKGAHAFEYGVLAALALRARALSAPGPLLRHACTALALVLAVAAVDEARQSRSSARTGALRDVVLDLSAGAIGAGTMAWLRRPERSP
jgi:VanZ family protein